MEKRLPTWTVRTARLYVFSMTWIAGIAAVLSPAAQRAAEAQVIPTAEGAGTTVTASGDQFDIAGGTQTGGNLFHEFDAFSLDESQTANFTSDSGVFNIVGQVSSANPSYIDGTVQVSGSDANLYLVNPSGVLFGADAQLSLGGSFTATTADQVEFNGEVLNVLDQPADYTPFKTEPTALHFTQEAASPVVNQGELSVAAGESLALVGGSVVNTGKLDASGGEIGLVAVDGNSTVTLATPGSLLSMEVNAAEFEMDLNTDDGFAATELPDLLTGGGAQSANGLTVNEDGSVTLGSHAIAEGTVAVTGDVSVSSDIGVGGSLALVGESITVVDAQIEASGTTGGSVRIGGDYRGEGTLPIAERVMVDEASVVMADGVEAAGGNVVVFAEETAVVKGQLSATGATTGGLVETSANYLTTTGIEVDTHGKTAGGRWLIDPINAEVVLNATGPNQFEASVIEAQIDSGSTFELETSGAGTGDGDIALRTSINQTNAASSGGLSFIGRRFEAGNHKINLASSGELRFDINAVNPESSPTSQSIRNAVDAIGNVTGNRLIRLGSGNYGFTSVVSLDTDVEIRGSGPLSTTLTMLATNSKIFRIGAGVEATVNGLTFTTSGLADTDVGGGIGNIGGVLTVNNSRFVDNRAVQNGGAIDSYAGGIVAISNSEFSGNRAGLNDIGLIGSGGAVHIGESTGINRIRNTSFEGNSAKDSGGALNVSDAELIVEDGGSDSTRTTFVGNSARFGGAVTFNGLAGNSGVFDAVVFEDNTATELGGALYLGGITTPAVSINDNVFNNNAAQSGGAIALLTPNTTDTGSTFTGNRAINGGSGGAINVGTTGGLTAVGSSFMGNTAATGNGGAIAVSTQAISLTDALFESNSAENGGGLVAWDGATVNLEDTTFIDNRAIVDLLSNPTSTGGNGGAIQATGSTLTITSDPLVSESSLFSKNTASQQGGAIYLSADTSTTPGTSIGSTANIAGTSFRLNEAAEGGGLYVENSTVNTTADTVFAQNTTTQANGGGIAARSSVVNVTDTTFERNDAAHDGGGISLIYDSVGTITNSSFNRNQAGDDGAGIYLSQNAAATVDTVQVIANTALDGGGGLYASFGSSVTATDVAFESNVARVGGGLRASDAVVTVASRAVPEGVTVGGRFSRNRARDLPETQLLNSSLASRIAAGGAISQSGGSLTLSNLKLSRNESEGDGGAVAIDGAATTVIESDTQFLLNTAEGNGGAIATTSTELLTVDYSFLGENHAEGNGGAMFAETAATVRVGNTGLLTNTANTHGGALSVGGGGDFVVNTSSLLESVAQGDGGAIYLHGNGLVSLESVNVSDNEAMGRGGALSNESETGQFTISNASINNNTASEGGAITTTAESVSTVFAAEFVGNEATAGNGGAVFVGGDSRLTVNRILFEQNNAADQGGAIFTTTSDELIVADTTFDRNTAMSDGGAIATQAGTTTSITGGQYLGNQASGNGGAIKNTGDLTLTGVGLTNNTTQASGGGLYNTGNASISDSRFEGNQATIDGGGIANEQTLIADGLEVIDNTAENGGGLSLRASAATVTDSVFEENQATAAGGGISAFSSTLTLRDAELINNQAGGDGGGMRLLDSIATIETTEFTDNQSPWGAGLEMSQQSEASLSDSSFTRNLATSFGGGIQVDNRASLNATGVTFEANRASSGGGLSNQGTSTLVNTTFSGNIADDSGGAIRNVGSAVDLSVQNSTFTLNQATNAGGGISSQSQTQAVHLVNSIVAGNIGATAADVEGGFVDGGFNLIGQVDGATGFTNSDWVGSVANPLDPKLAPLANNGGPTSTHAPLVSSVAVNTGGSNVVNLPTVDQRGLLRISGSAVDIGAVELSELEGSAVEPPEPPTDSHPQLPVTSPLDPTLSSTDFSTLDTLLAIRTKHDLSESNAAIRRLESTFSQSFEDYWDLSAGPDLTFDQVQVILRRAQEEYKVNSAVIYATFAPEEPAETEADTNTILQVDPASADDDVLNLSVVMPEGELVSYQLPVTRQEAVRQVRYFRSAVSDPEDARSYQPLAQQLYQWLLAPLEEDLAAQNIQNLMYALDTGLRTAPITAMRDYNGFSLERYGISVVPSMGLMQADFPVSVRRSTIAMGVSEFTSEIPLPAVPIELQVVDQFVPVSQTVLNESTTLEALKSVQALDQPGILHLATHASFDRRSPEDSYIHLWNESLSMQEFSQLDWKGSDLEMLILSACSTALGSRNSELGFAGLAAASGVDATVGSLWEVSDVGTLALMSEFYAQLEETDLRFEALRRAQLSLLNGDTRIEGGNLITGHGEVDLPDEWDLPDSATLDHPFFWSAFTMVGNPW